MHYTYAVLLPFGRIVFGFVQSRIDTRVDHVIKAEDLSCIHSTGAFENQVHSFDYITATPQNMDNNM